MNKQKNFFVGYCARTCALVFAGLLVAMLPDWGTSLRAQQIIDAVDDIASTTAGTPVDINVLANDDLGGGLLQSVTLGSPANGSVVLSATNTVTYTPEPGFVGIDTFTYTILVEINGEPFQDTATVTVNVTPSPVVAVADTASTPAGNPVTINVLNNDSGIGLSVLNTTAPLNGSVVINETDSITYTPDPGFASPPNDTFTYTIIDEFEQTATATVTITVVPPELEAVDDTATTPAGTPVTIDVLANDIGTGFIIDVTDPPNGSVSVVEGESITYTPDPGFASPPNDTFTYTIIDEFEQTDTATVTVTVTGSPTEIDAVDDVAFTEAGTPVTIAVLANDSGTGLTITNITAPGNGSAVLTGNAITYTPAAGFANASDSFTYTITDSEGQSDTATVTVNVAAPDLNAVNDAATTPAGEPVIISVLANDVSAGNTEVSITQVSTPSSGSTAINTNNTITYIPAPGFVGTATFTYTISDGFSSDTATVTVTITAPDLDAVDDAATTPARQPIVISVLANDVGTDLTITQVSTPANGSAAANTDGTITYTPAINFAGNDNFTYTISDGIGSDTATVTVVVTAPALQAVDDTASVGAGQPVAIPVLDNDIGSALTIIQVSEPANGSTIIAADGSITYTSTPRFNGNDSFTYTISDGIGSSTATVTVTVTLTKEDIQNTLEELGNTPNERAIARSVGGLCFDRSASADFLRDCDALVDAALAGDPSAGPALEQITPDALGNAVDTTQTSILTQTSNVRSRLFSLRSGVMGINIDRLNINRGGWTLSGQDLRYLLADVGGGGPSAEPPGYDLGALGVFINGTINFGDRDSTSNQDGYDFETYGLTLGADYRFTDQLVFGTALSYTSTDTDIDSQGGYLDSRGYALTLYGTYYQSDQFYIDGMLNYGWFDYDQRRNVSYQLPNADVNQSFDADYDGQQFFLDLGAGYEFARGNFVFGPEARLSYLDLQVDDFQEQANDNNSGSAWAIGVDDQDLQSLTFSLGGRVGYLLDQSWGVLEPQMELTWLHEFKDDNRVVRGRFIEGATVPDNFFELTTDPVDRNYFRFGLGLSAQFNRGGSALLRYRTLLDYDNLEDHAISAEFRWEF